MSKQIDDPATDNDKKATYLHQRILINYEKKKWTSKFNWKLPVNYLFFILDVINDIEMFEQINDSNLFKCMKM